MNGIEERLVSECCAVLFCLSVPYVYFLSSTLCTLEWTTYLLCRKMGGGVLKIFGWVSILFGGGVKTNNYAPYKPNKSMKTVGRKQNEGHRYLHRQQSITNMPREKRLPDYANCINLHYKEKSSGKHVQL